MAMPIMPENPSFANNFYNTTKLFADICETAAEKSPECAMRMLSAMKIPSDPAMLHLYNATLGYIGCAINEKMSERAIQNKFFDGLSKYIPGAVKVERKGSEGNIPDGFIEIYGEVIPVEVKRDAFTYKSLVQLSRYIKHWKCKRGVAVARSLDCKLPEHIIFVQVS
jgi:hypothetical protein